MHDIRAGSPESLIRSSLAQIRDEGLRSALFDILVLLNNGSIEEAKNRTLHHLGQFKSIAELSSDEILELDMGDGTRKVELGSKERSLCSRNDWFLCVVQFRHFRPAVSAQRISRCREMALEAEAVQTTNGRIAPGPKSPVLLFGSEIPRD